VARPPHSLPRGWPATPTQPNGWRRPPPKAGWGWPTPPHRPRGGSDLEDDESEDEFRAVGESISEVECVSVTTMADLKAIAEPINQRFMGSRTASPSLIKEVAACERTTKVDIGPETGDSFVHVQSSEHFLGGMSCTWPQFPGTQRG
jgi:hypothetical protein